MLRNPTDPVTGAAYVDAGGTPCVANNRIAPGCISPVAKKFLEFQLSKKGQTDYADQGFRPGMEPGLGRRGDAHGRTVRLAAEIGVAAHRPERKVRSRVAGAATGS